MNVILVLGRNEDICCQLVQAELLKLGRAVLFLPEDQLFPQFGFTWQPDPGGGAGTLTYQGCQVSLSEVAGCLCRCYGLPVAMADFATKDGQYISAEWNALLMAWLARMPCPVINRLRPELWYKTNLNVLDLLALAPNSGFRLPRTVITTRTDDLQTFSGSVGGAFHYSPLAQPIPYAINGAAELAQLNALHGVLPFHLSENVAGTPFDAFVIGRHIVLVQSLDASGRTLPPQISTQCLALGQTLQLSFYRLALVENAAGDWYCLGLDRMPQLFPYSAAVQQMVVQQLAHFLCGTEGRNP